MIASNDKLVNGAIILALLIFISSMQLMPQNNKQFLSAKESDPKNFGWMQGFPLPADKVLHTWDGSFFEFPAIRWSVVHMRQMLPTASNKMDVIPMISNK